ncbi:hypothetical protein GCM10017687_38200 [Streptomyces echinatus]
MSLITTLARLEAVGSGRAQPAATVRHRHLSDRPLVFVPLTTAGETGAPLGALVGTDRDAPRLLVVPQPRDRDLRFTFLADLADVVLPYIDAYAGSVEAAERTETDPETGKRSRWRPSCGADAPQLIVPSRAGLDLVRLLGRSMRFRRTAEQDPDAPYPAPPRVPLLVPLAHPLRRAVPGPRLLAAARPDRRAVPALGDRPVRLEDQHLGALLAWIAPAGRPDRRRGRPPGRAGAGPGRAVAVPAGRSRDRPGVRQQAAVPGDRAL